MSINLTNQSAPYEPSVPSARQLQTGRLDTTWSGGIGSQDYGRIVTSGGCWTMPSLFKRKRRTSKRTTKRKARKSRKSKQQKRR